MTDPTGFPSTANIGPLLRYKPDEMRHPLPLRGVSYGVDTVRRVLAGKLNPDLPLFTLRHRGETIVLTLRDLKLCDEPLVAQTTHPPLHPEGE